MQDSVLPRGVGAASPPHHPFYSFYPFYLFKIPLSLQNFLQNSLRRFVTFSKILAIFRLLKTFLSYQQVINNSPFSTQFFENLSA
ncbi:MAG: hypothetical protein IKW38_01345, partial [Kiritimatiellae bacterium]|nr:hypothetical protein [Kiritimatiellia bacterium]